MTRKEILGDGIELWLGDCVQLMGDLQAADHVIGDPPYEKEAHRKDRRVMRKDGLVAGALSFRQIAEIEREEVARQAARISRGWIILFCQAEGVAPWRDALEAAGAKYKAPMVWIKPDGMPQFNGQGPGMGFESMVAAWAGKGHSVWNGGGQHGVFTFPKGEGVPNVHETQKPVRLMSKLITLFTQPGDVVLDPFMGSATTGVACVKAGRRFIGMEKDPAYFDVACKRIDEVLRQGDIFTTPPAKAKQEAFEL